MLRIKRYILNKIFDIIDVSNSKEAKNIERSLQKKALKETVEFVEENMIKIKSFQDKIALLKYSIDCANKNGIFAEFGVFEGETINYISSNINHIVYGFDSFEGLPEDWRDQFEKGKFRVEEVPHVNKNVTLIKGWFEDTLPQFLLEHPENCSFIHIDCDLYSSTKTIFNHLNERIKKGTIIVFDEFFNYPGWKNGEYNAFMEFIKFYNVKFEYIGYCRYDEQVTVKILSVGVE